MRMADWVYANGYGFRRRKILRARMECAALCSHLSEQPGGTVSGFGFTERRIDRCVISSFTSRPGKNRSVTSSSQRHQSEESRGNFFGRCLLYIVTDSSDGSRKQYRRAIPFPGGQNCPRHAREFVGQSYSGHFVVSARGQLAQPVPQTR